MNKIDFSEFCCIDSYIRWNSFDITLNCWMYLFSWRSLKKLIKNLNDIYVCLNDQLKNINVEYENVKKKHKMLNASSLNNKVFIIFIFFNCKIFLMILAYETRYRNKCSSYDKHIFKWRITFNARKVNRCKEEQRHLKKRFWSSIKFSSRWYSWHVVKLIQENFLSAL